LKKTEIKKLDRKWSAIVRAKGYCEWCGKTQYLNAHHYIGRRNRNVRWYVPNGVCLCAGCHTFKATSAHQHPEMFREFILDERGLGWLDDLIAKARIDCLASKQIYEDVLKELNNANT
jgi:hypothetical protein